MENYLKFLLYTKIVCGLKLCYDNDPKTFEQTQGHWKEIIHLCQVNPFLKKRLVKNVKFLYRPYLVLEYDEKVKFDKHTKNTALCIPDCKIWSVFVRSRSLKQWCIHYSLVWK